MRRAVRFLQSGLLLLLIVGCSGGGGGDESLGGATVSGTVAVGRPVAGVVVQASCTESSSYSSAPTDAGGSFSLRLPAVAFPCLLQANLPGGGLLRSFALQPGVVNVTSLTEGVVALAGGSPAGASVGKAKLLSAMSAMGIAVPADPITAPFVADGTGMDAALDALGRAIAASSASGTSVNSWFAALAATCTGPQCAPVEAFCQDPSPTVAALCEGVLKQVDEKLLGLPSLIVGGSADPTIERATKYVASVVIRRLAADARVGNWIRTQGEAQVLKRFGDALYANATDSIDRGLTGSVKNIVEWWATLVADVLVDVAAQAIQENFSDVFGSNPTVPSWLPGAQGSDWGYAFTLYVGTSVSHAAIASVLGGKPPIIAGLEGAVDGAIAVIVEDVKLGIDIAAIYSDTARADANTAAAQYVSERYEWVVEQANAIYVGWQSDGRNDSLSQRLRQYLDAVVRPGLSQTLATKTSDGAYVDFLVVVQNRRLDALVRKFEQIDATQPPLWITQFSNSSVVPGQGMAGVRLGDAESAVVARLGKPTQGPTEVKDIYGNVLFFALMYFGRGQEFLGVYTTIGSRTVFSMRAYDGAFNSSGYAPLVQGATIGSTRQQLVQALGSPVRQDTHGTCPLATRDTTTYFYTGISFWVCEQNNLVYLIDVP